MHLCDLFDNGQRYITLKILDEQVSKHVGCFHYARPTGGTTPGKWQENGRKME